IFSSDQESEEGDYVMKLRQCVAAAALALLALGCEKSLNSSVDPLPTKGVNVGNGLKTYTSAKYTYQFKYSDLLQLDEVSPEIVVVDNGHLAGPDQLSSAAFRIDTNAPADLSALQTYLSGKYPTLTFSAVTVNGLNGFSSEDTAGNEYKAVFYFPVKDKVLSI